MISTETLARELHEAGRAAVVMGATVAAGNFGEKARKFLEWEEITEEAREGRMIQARYLLHRFDICRHFAQSEKNHIEETVARNIFSMAMDQFIQCVSEGRAQGKEPQFTITSLCCEISKKYHL